MPPAQEIAQQAGVRVLSWDEMLALGRGAPAEAIPPKPEDLCTIMYTSGTTGNPKAWLYSTALSCAVLRAVAGIRGHQRCVLAVEGTGVS